MITLESLANAWHEAKAAELAATAKRREAEDALVEAMRLNPAHEGTTRAAAGVFEVKATQRITRKVDADMVQEIAAEHGMSYMLGSLFRWKPEINVKAWDACSDDIKRALAPAITATPGRATFSISVVNKE